MSNDDAALDHSAPLAARLLIFARWLIVPAWIAVAIFVQVRLPPLETYGHGGLLGAIPATLPAIKAQRTSYEQFGLPVVTRVVIVSRYNQRLSLPEQATEVQKILKVSSSIREQENHLAFALPVTQDLFPGAKPGAGKSVFVTYLFFDGQASVGDRERISAAFEQGLQNQTDAEFVGGTGSLAASQAQADQVSSSLHVVELATLAVVIAIVAIRFRSVGAPVLTLVTIGISYVVVNGLLQQTSEQLGMAIPSEARPLLVVLLFGIVTDYAVFFLASFRHEYEELLDTPLAAQRAFADVAPIVATAAVIVAAGSLSLLVTRIGLLSQLAPSLAIGVTISAVVAITFVPCVLAIGGRLLFWPSRLEEQNPGAEEARWSVRIESVLVKPLIAAPVLLLTLGLLVYASLTFGGARLATNLIADLPSSSEPQRAEKVAQSAYPDGIIAPTEVVLQAPGIANQKEQLGNLEDFMSKQPGVAQVLGPREQPLSVTSGLVYAPNGNAARFVVVFEDSPFSSRAISSFRNIEQNLPQAMRQAGLDGSVLFSGDTALSSEIAHLAFVDFLRVSGVLIAAELVILAIFLRSLLAPAVLLIVSSMVVLSALGLTAVISRFLLGEGSLTFYVPVAVAVLLLSLGSDYNLFLIGQIWEARRDHPLRQAIVYTGSRASSAIITAGLALAFSFSLLAIIPIQAFRQLAIAMFVGLVADILIVRPVLVPSLLAVLGPLLTWPSKARPQRPPRTRPQGQEGWQDR